MAGVPSSVTSAEALLTRYVVAFCDAPSLAALASVSKSLYCSCTDERLWSSLCLQKFGSSCIKTYCGSWRGTYLLNKQPSRGAAAIASTMHDSATTTLPPHAVDRANPADDIVDLPLSSSSETQAALSLLKKSCRLTPLVPAYMAQWCRSVADPGKFELPWDPYHGVSKYDSSSSPGAAKGAATGAADLHVATNSRFCLNAMVDDVRTVWLQHNYQPQQLLAAAASSQGPPPPAFSTTTAPRTATCCPATPCRQHMQQHVRLLSNA